MKENKAIQLDCLESSFELRRSEWHLVRIKFKQLESREPVYCCATVRSLREAEDKIAALYQKEPYAAYLYTI